MTHGRPPRRPGRVSLRPRTRARNRAARLTPTEIANTIDPLRAAARALREGIGSEDNWARVVSAVTVAQAIERQGIVRGLAEHLRGAEAALDAIHARAHAGSSWCAVPLAWEEIERIDAVVDLHEFQMGALSYGEFRQALQRAARVVIAGGGRVIAVPEGSAA